MKITGTLRKEEVKQFKRKDGSVGESKSFFIEPEGSIYPIEVSTSNMNLKVGKIGDKVNLDINLYPYYFENNTRKKAYITYYIPNKD